MSLDISNTKRRCSSCKLHLPESEFSDFRTGSRPCRRCERERVVGSRWQRIPLIKLRHEVEAEEARLIKKKAVLAEREAAKNADPGY